MPRGAISSVTKRSYERHQREFLAWCRGRVLDPAGISPAELERYLVDRFKHGGAGGTVKQVIAALDHWMVSQGCDLPATRAERVRSFARRAGNNLSAIPISVVEVGQLLGACPDTTSGLRDRALIALARTTCFRRSRLVRMTVADYKALRIVVTEVDAWLERSGIAWGALFPSIRLGGHIMPGHICEDTISRIIKRRAAQSGIDPAFCNATALIAGA